MNRISTCRWADLETSAGQPSKEAEQGRCKHKCIYFGQSNGCMVGNEAEKARAQVVDTFDIRKE